MLFQEKFKINNILIYGGTFDPPHLGHINTALSVQKYFHFERFVFLPCKVPVLKNEAAASAFHRVKMLCLALEDYPEFCIDLREIKRDTPSYMYETLNSYRQEFGPHYAITVLLGMDAFMQLSQWYRWESLLDDCHLLVMHRMKLSMTMLPKEIQQLLEMHQTKHQNTLKTQSHGSIFIFDAGNYPVSSTDIRESASHTPFSKEYLDPKVYQYMCQMHLYLK